MTKKITFLVFMVGFSLSTQEIHKDHLPLPYEKDNKKITFNIMECGTEGKQLVINGINYSTNHQYELTINLNTLAGRCVYQGPYISGPFTSRLKMTSYFCMDTNLPEEQNPEEKQLIPLRTENNKIFYIADTNNLTTYYIRYHARRKNTFGPGSKYYSWRKLRPVENVLNSTSDAMLLFSMAHQQNALSAEVYCTMLHEIVEVLDNELTLQCGDYYFELNLPDEFFDFSEDNLAQ